MHSSTEQEKSRPSRDVHKRSHDEEDEDNSSSNINGMIASMTEMFNFKDDALGSDDEDDLEEYAFDVEKNNTDKCDGVELRKNKSSTRERKVELVMTNKSNECEKKLLDKAPVSSANKAIAPTLALEEDLNDL